MRLLRYTHLAHALTVIVAIALPLLAGAQRNRPASNRQRIDSTFAFSRTGELSISVRGGEVRVTGWARNDARVVAIGDRGTITMDASSSRIQLGVRPQTMSRAQFEINVPIGVRVNVSAASANIDVSGTRGELSLTTVNGKITASDGAGRTRIGTAAGTVELQRLSGESHVGSMTGPITITEIDGELSLTTITAPAKIRQADLSGLTVEAAQGNLDFSGRLSAQGKHNIETFGGNVELHFPADFAATIDMESLNGKLRTDFDVTMRPRNTAGQARTGERQQYTINGGGALITISTFNGGVFLRRLAASTRR
jgi:hypothetical protein